MNADPRAARETQHQLEEIGAYLNQFRPAEFRSADGYAALSESTLLPREVATNAYPTDGPRRLAQIPPMQARRLAMENSQGIRDLESRLSRFGLQNFVDATGANSLMPANAAGIRPTHGFQVFWIGSSREWLLNEGTFRWIKTDPATGEVKIIEHPFGKRRYGASTTWQWIALKLIIWPRKYDSTEDPQPAEVGTFTISEPVLVISNHLADYPCAMKLVVAGENGEKTYRTYSQGTYHIPIARVRAPSLDHPAPRIIPWMRGDINLTRSDAQFWALGLPAPA